MRNRLLNRYVGQTVLAATAIVLVAFAGLDVLFRIIEEATKMEKDYTFMRVVIYEFLKTPARLYEFMPMVGLIGCLTGLGAMANSSELVVMRSAGVSTFRLLWIALRPALLFLLAAMMIGEYMAPRTEQIAHSYRAQARGHDTTFHSARGVWIRDGRDFVLINVVQPTGVMYGVNLFRFDDKKRLYSIVQAERATFSRDYWLLENVDRTHFDIYQSEPQRISKASLEFWRWHSSLQPDLLSIAAADAEDLPMRELWPYIRYLREQELNSNEYELAFWEKIFYPLVMISLVIAGISFVFGPLRQVSMGYRVFWGILIGILFKTLQDTLGPVSIVFGFSAMYAMLIPVLLCILLGAILLSRVR